MNVERVIKELPLQCEKNLRAVYETCCEVYRKRLCEQWEQSVEYSFWIADIVGDELSIGDCWVLDMTEVKYCVDNCVTYEAYDEYWEFCMEEYKGHDRPRINFFSWFTLGCRPKDLKEE